MKYETILWEIEYAKDILRQEIPWTKAQEAIDILLESFKNKKNNEWVPVTYRPITEEEREEYGYDEDITYMFTCPLPDDGDEVLISRNNGKWIDLVTFCNGDYGVGDEDWNDWIEEVDA